MSTLYSARLRLWVCGYAEGHRYQGGKAMGNLASADLNRCAGVVHRHGIGRRNVVIDAVTGPIAPEAVMKDVVVKTSR
jgi:hypothetical protein